MKSDHSGVSQLAFMFAIICFSTYVAASDAPPHAAMKTSRPVELSQLQSNHEPIAAAHRAVELAEPNAKSDPDAYGDALHDLGFAYKRSGQLIQAERYYKRALAVRDGIDPLSRGTAITLNNLALVLSDLSRFSEAEPLFQRSLKIREKIHDGQGAAVVLNNLAALFLAQKRFSDAEPLLKQSLELRTQLIGEMSREVGTATNNLALLYHEQGRYTDAEIAYKRAIAIREAVLPEGDPQLGTTLSGLAVLYRIQGRLNEAVPLFERSLDILAKSLPREHPDLAKAKNNFGIVKLEQGQYSEAEALYEDALRIREKIGDRSQVATTLLNLSSLKLSQRRYSDAEKFLTRALIITEEVFGPGSTATSVVLNSLGGLYLEQGRYSSAKELFERALKIRENALGSSHPDLVQSLTNLGGVLFLDSDWQGAVSSLRRATQAAMLRSQVRPFSIALDVSGAGQDNLARRGRTFGLFAQALHRFATQNNDDLVAQTDESFKAAQWTLYSSTAFSIAQMGARHAPRDPALTTLVRERQDLAREWHWRDVYLTKAVSQESKARDIVVENESRARLTSIETRIGEIDRSLAEQFPDYSTLTSPLPLSWENAQGYLNNNEALIVLVTLEKLRAIAGETFLWVVTREGSRWVRIPQGTAELTEKVQALRCGLDAQEWDGISRAARCGQLLGIDGQPEPGGPLPFHLGLAHELYQALLGPVEDLIRDKHLLIVPSGPLTSLPFQVLVTDKPATDQPKTYDDYKGVAWLGRRQPLTVLPSVSSLQALRKFAKTSTAQKPYVGYGNPVLQGDGACRTAVAPEACTPVLTAAVGSQAPARQHSLERSGSLDRIYRKGASQEAVLAEVRALCPLPDTAFELRCVARSLGVPESEVRLGATSTEADLKQRSEAGELANYRVVHFATHGLLAGDTEMMARRQGEPALVLTPPEAPRDMDDDGLLTASEVAQLKLNADWVILSACNTAAGDKLGAEALSGLARAFFYAGARALLVSHWPVYSDAAVELMDKAFAELRQDPSIGRSEALRRAMVALMDNPALSDNPHPSIWAPFSLVGEGAQ
jgi:CHAT domain-containing protein/tetratricopeptide (TPR) repeat protein